MASVLLHRRMVQSSTQELVPLSRGVLCAKRRMADLGMNIVTVIHQPRYSVFSLFHEVLLLGKAGRTVFPGPVQVRCACRGGAWTTLEGGGRWTACHRGVTAWWGASVSLEVWLCVQRCAALLHVHRL